MTDHRIPDDDASDAASETDRKWFEQHPDRVIDFVGS